MKNSLSKEKSLAEAKDIILSEMVFSEEERDSLNLAISSNLENRYGTNLKNISLQYSDEKNFSTDSMSIPTEGFSLVINNLSKELNIKTSHIVSKIEYDKKLLCFKDENRFIKIDFLNPNNTNRSNKPTSTEFIENNLPAPLKSTVRKDIKTGKQTQSYIELVFDNIKAVQYIN